MDISRVEAEELLAQSEEISADEVKLLYPQAEIPEYLAFYRDSLSYQFWVGPDEKLYYSLSAPKGVGLMRLCYWWPERGARDHPWETVYDWNDHRPTD